MECVELLLKGTGLCCSCSHRLQLRLTLFCILGVGLFQEGHAGGIVSLPRDGQWCLPGLRTAGRRQGTKRQQNRTVAKIMYTGASNRKEGHGAATAASEQAKGGCKHNAAVKSDEP